MKLALFIAVLAAPVAAQDVGQPKGCTAFLTVHTRSCSVDHYFRCPTDNKGDVHRTEYSENGMTYMGTTDVEAQWITSHHIAGEFTEVLEHNPAKPASFSDLLATSVNEYDFVTMSQENGPTNYIGRDTLTGKQVMIDGVTLDETTYEVTSYDDEGSMIFASKGREFISRDWRIFFGGQGTVKTPERSFKTDNTPVEFIHPDETGFLSKKPKYGCDTLMSLAPEMQEYSHDNL